MDNAIQIGSSRPVRRGHSRSPIQLVREMKRKLRRRRKSKAAPHLAFRNPADIDRYTETDLRAIDAFYRKAAEAEPSGRVYLPAAPVDADRSAYEV